MEASPNMSSEFVQYNRYEWREGVDGSARLFNPVAAALIDTETDDAVCSFIHSFIQTISIAPLQVQFYSEVLPTQHRYCARV